MARTLLTFSMLACMKPIACWQDLSQNRNTSGENRIISAGSPPISEKLYPLRPGRSP
jgi:hypothetical protein